MDDRPKKKLKKMAVESDEDVITAPTKPEPAPVVKKIVAKVAESEKVGFKNQAYVVEEFAQRWWYVLPAYPPTNYDYSAKLNELKLE